MSYSIFLVCFRFRTVQGRNGEWRGFLSYLRLNLLLRRVLRNSRLTVKLVSDTKTLRHADEKAQ